jgi:hypothetical protein
LPERKSPISDNPIALTFPIRLMQRKQSHPRNAPLLWS